MSQESRVLRELPLAVVIPTADNPRTIDESSEEFKLLVESIRAHGVKVPVHVRPHPSAEGKFDLRAGAQRLRASAICGLATIPAIVDEGMTDSEAMLMTYQENADRIALDPLAEGKMVASLLDSHGGNVTEVAQLLGRKYTWVAQRAHIWRGLSEEWKKACRAKLSGWSARALALVSRLDPRTQRDILGFAARREEFNPLTVEDVEGLVAERVRPVAKAPFDVHALQLIAGVPPCDMCKKRSQFAPGLWEEDGSPAAAQKNDRCLDVACWRAKSAAALKVRIAKFAEEDGKAPLIVAGENAGEGDAEAAAKAFGNCLLYYQYEKSAKGKPGSVRALVVAGAGAGKEMWVRPYGSGARPAPPKLSTAQKREQLKARRWNEVLKRFSKDLRTFDVTRLVDGKGKALETSRAAAVVLALAGTFGTNGDFSPTSDWERVGGILKKKDALAAALDVAWQDVRRQLAHRCRGGYASTDMPVDGLAFARGAAALFAIDLDQMYKAVSIEKGFTEPKSWAQESLDAKAKTTQKRAAKKAGKAGGR